MRIELWHASTRMIKNEVNAKHVEAEQVKISPKIEQAKEKKTTKSLDECISFIENNNQTPKSSFNRMILRSSDDRLIVPDEIYDALENYTGSDAMEFARSLANTEDEKELSYYANWFKLVQDEGGLEECIKLSDYGDVDIQDLINSGKASVTMITEENNQIIEEVPVNTEDSFQADKEYEKIEKELNEIMSNIVITSKEDYENIKSKLLGLEEKVYKIYTKTLDSIVPNNPNIKEILSNAELKYNEIIDKIETEFNKLEKIYNQKILNNKVQRVNFGSLLIRPKDKNL